MNIKKTYFFVISVFLFCLITGFALADNTFPGNGNVGIGTTSPISKLHVTGGEIRATDGGNAGVAIYAAGGRGDVAAYNWGSGFWYNLAVKGYHVLLQPQGGNVGIGTENPQAQFVVSGGDGGERGIRIYAEGEDGVIAGNASNSIDIKANPSTPQGGQLFVASNGKVGIGTNHPMTPLNVSGNIAGGDVTLSITNLGAANASSTAVLEFRGYQDTVPAGQPFAMIQAVQEPHDEWGNAVSTGELAFWTKRNSDAQMNEWMRITDNGIVFVGSHGYGAQFVVTGGPTENMRGVLMKAVGSDGVIAGYAANSLDIKANPNAPTGSQLFVASNGKVGINTTNPQASLDVNGEVAAQCFAQNSSRDYKNDINHININEQKNMLSTIMSLNLATFTYKDDPKKEKRLGLIAEETPKALLTKNGKAISTFDLVSHLVGAVKTQQKQIKTQLNHIETQQMHIKNQEIRMARLENYLEKLIKGNNTVQQTAHSTFH